MNRTVNLGLKWWEALLVLGAAIIPATQGAAWASILTGCAAGIAFGVWRAVQILGYQLEHMQAGDEENHDI